MLETKELEDRLTLYERSSASRLLLGTSRYEGTQFPAFFPVSREFAWRKIRTRPRPPPASLGVSPCFSNPCETWKFAAQCA
jgi:hypothetical protein